MPTRQQFQTQGSPAVTGLFTANIAAGATQSSAIIDFGSITDGSILIECLINTLTGTTDGDRQAVVSLRWGASPTGIDGQNNIKDRFAVAIPATSAAGAFSSMERRAIRGRYLIIDIRNAQNIGPAISTSSSIKLTLVTEVQV